MTDWFGSYAWHLRQPPSIIAELRDRMTPGGARQFDRSRITGTKDHDGPLRWEPMEDADRLWASLLWHANTIGRHLAVTLPPAFGAAHMTATGDWVIPTGLGWKQAATAAQDVTGWMIRQGMAAGAIEDPTVDAERELLFSDIRRLLAKYRVTPRRLRTSSTFCVLCDHRAVVAEWVINADGDVARTAQCTHCGLRYDPGDPLLEACSLEVAS